MATREVDAISTAIIETEREIAGSAWDQEDTERDEGGRDLEEMGGGLEGQHEAEDELEVDEEVDGEDESEAEGEGEGEGEAATTGKKPGEAESGKDGKGKDGEVIPPVRTEPEGRVPSGKLREANEARRVAEAERDRLAQELEAAKKVPDNRSEIETLKTQVSALTQMLQGQRQPPQKTEEPAAPKPTPDIFENPQGFVDHITSLVQSAVGGVSNDVRATRVETSMAIAHAFHKDTFEEAFAAINKLNPQNPDDRVIVQRIYNSPNPGDALVGWHKKNKALAEVGDDPAVYREKIAKETRETLMKDPEFRKQLIADLRGEAASGDNGRPRTETRLPRSLARASGSNLGAERNDPRGSEDSEQAVADAAWRTG